MGGAMAYYRHFFEREDFEVFVATDDKRVLQYELPYTALIFDQPRWLERLTRSRFSLWAHSYKHLIAGYFIPKEVLQAARDFQPDMILTIAGSWGWTTLMAQQLARKLNVPLVGSFNDWFDFSILIHPYFRSRLEKKFRNFYHNCDLAWCTSEGMRDELGAHPNAQILYPVGARPQITATGLEQTGASDRFVIAFAGNLSDWYGRMLEQLVTTAIQNRAPVEFRIYGGNQSWSREFESMARVRNIYRGHLPFDELSREMAHVDALILPMGFEPESAQIERTSFKTKFLDYLSYEKPILVWGPEYCSAVRVAREFDSAEVCTQAGAEAVLEKILILQQAPDRREVLRRNARAMYQGRFHPDKIHAHFVRHSLNLLKKSQGNDQPEFSQADRS